MPERLDLTGLCPPPSSVAVVSNGDRPVKAWCISSRRQLMTSSSHIRIHQLVYYILRLTASSPILRLLQLPQVFPPSPYLRTPTPLRSLDHNSGWDIAIVDFQHAISKLYLSAWCRRKQSFSPASLFVKHQRSNRKCLPTTLSRIEESMQSGMDDDLPRIRPCIKLH